MGENVSLIDGHIDSDKKQTNYEHIRNMSVEEMAKRIYKSSDKLLDEICMCNTVARSRECLYGDEVEPKHCINCIKQYLESEVDIE